MVLKHRCKEQLMTEIKYMIWQRTQPLNRFLKRLLHCYKIENVIGMIEGLKNDQPLATPKVNSQSCKTSELMRRMTLLASISFFSSIYRSESICRNSFTKHISQQCANQDQNIDRDAYLISSLMNEFKTEKIKNMVKKNLLTKFHKYYMANLLGDNS